MNTENNKQWNWFWSIGAGIMIIWNSVSIVQGIIEQEYWFTIIMFLLNLCIIYIFIISVSRLIKEEQHDKGSNYS